MQESGIRSRFHRVESAPAIDPRPIRRLCRRCQHLRNDDSRAEWQKVAGQAGLHKNDVVFIQTGITTNREAIIRQEYDYVAGQCEILDGSPSYLWESQKVADIRKLDAFKGINSSDESCSH